MSDTSDGSKCERSAPQQPPQKRWQFIDASNDSSANLTQVKRHVMQEYIRQKRRDAQHRDGAGDAQGEGQKSQRKRRQRQKRIQAANAADIASGEKGEDTSGRRKQKGKAISTQDDTQTQDVDPEKSTSADDVEEIERNFAAGAFEYEDPNSLFPSSSSVTFLPHRSFASVDGLMDPFTPSPSLYSQESQSYDGLADAILSRFQGSASGSRSSSPRSSYRASPPLQSPTPRTILSAARTDPFDSLPVQLDAEEKRLFDFYVNEMPACSYGTLIRSPKAHNWYTEVFVPEAMKGAVSFQNTIIVHAANTWAWVRNETETKNTLIHRGRAICMLRKHMAKNPKDISDAAIVACMSAAALEDFDPRPGHKEISWVHWRVAREMIRNRGGPAAFENTRLAMLINWQDYILAGYETNGPSFYFEHNPVLSPIGTPESWPSSKSQESRSFMPSPPYLTSSISSGHIPSSPTETYYVPQMRKPLSPTEEIQHQCEEFISFLKRSEQLAMHQLTTPPKKSAPTRHTAFQDGSLLYRILASPPGRRFTSTGDRKQIISRQASLMMLNAALWDYRFSIQRSEVFLKSLIMKVLESEVDMSGSVEALLQILLACKDGFTDEPETSSPGSSSSSEYLDAPDFSQYSPTATSVFARPWFIGRMLKVAKRLGVESWERFSDVLFSCLTLEVQEPVVPSWEQELRREILEAPLMSYVMPALPSEA